MKIALFGAGGKVGSVLVPALERAGHDVVDGRGAGPEGADVAVDFTRPDAVLENARRCIGARVPVVVGTTGFDVAALDDLARDAGVPCFYAANFALGAVLMMRFAEEASGAFPKAEIVELHADTKLDAPSGTSKATADRMGGDVPIHSVRLPGLVAHQEVILGDVGQTLTIRHDSIDRESFMPGVVLAVRAVGSLPDRVTVGLDALL